jgi:hypothetical protein
VFPVDIISEDIGAFFTQLWTCSDLIIFSIVSGIISVFKTKEIELSNKPSNIKSGLNYGNN